MVSSHAGIFEVSVPAGSAAGPEEGGPVALIRKTVSLIVLTATTFAAQAAPNLLIIFSGSTPPVAQMVASGKFGTVTTFNAASGTPTPG